MKRASKFEIFFTKLIWKIVADPKVKSFYSLKRTNFVKHTCKYAGAYEMLHGYPFIRCIHYGCSTYCPVDELANQFGDITKYEYRIKRLNYYKELLANYKYSSYSISFDNSFTNYIRTMIKSCEHDILNDDFKFYHERVTKEQSRPYLEQNQVDMQYWMGRMNDLLTQMKSIG